VSEGYRSKRDFSRTPEPRGGGRKSGSKPVFVIQQHDATSLHYDFRIEVDGVLKSWAVPKGPSTDPREKRLAVPTEDHPLEYQDFEGVIPEGEYGAGAVLVWDRGPFENVTESDGERFPMDRALRNGHVVIRLHGHKLQGDYLLQRTSGSDDEKWLLIKVDDEAADARRNPVSTEPESVLSGRTIEEVAREEAGGES
jgi:DNA ligase D-like protein (predicted 3'-phosphoesterase)